MHTLFFQTPIQLAPALPYLGRVSLPSLLPRTEASFSNFAAGPSNDPRQREREREGGEKKISLSRTIIPRFPWDYPNLRRPVGVRSRIREHIS